MSAGQPPSAVNARCTFEAGTALMVNSDRNESEVQAGVAPNPDFGCCNQLTGQRRFEDRASFH
jgi:hypothetical protein